MGLSVPKAPIRFHPSGLITKSISQQQTLGHIQRPTTYSVAANVTSQQQSSTSQQGQQQIFHKNSQQRTAQIQLSQQAKKIIQGGQIIQNSNLNHQRTVVVASSSSLPFLSLSSNQAMRAAVAGTIPQAQSQIVAQQPQQPQQQLQLQQQFRNAVLPERKTELQTQPQHQLQQTQQPNSSTKIPKIPGKGGRGSRSNSNRPPPGAVNLERSYQICQAVIQNSPNRHQLKGQLKPPPSMLSGPAPGGPVLVPIPGPGPIASACVLNATPATATATATVVTTGPPKMVTTIGPTTTINAASTTIKREQAVSSTNRTVYKVRPLSQFQHCEK